MPDEKRYTELLKEVRMLANRVTELEGVWEILENHTGALYVHKDFMETVLEDLSEEDRKLFEAKISEKTRINLAFLREEDRKETESLN